MSDRESLPSSSSSICSLSDLSEPEYGSQATKAGLDRMARSQLELGDSSGKGLPHGEMNTSLSPTTQRTGGSRLRGILTSNVSRVPRNHTYSRSGSQRHVSRPSSTKRRRSRSYGKEDPRMRQVPLSRDFLLIIGLCVALACALICFARPAIFAVYEHPLI